MARQRTFLATEYSGRRSILPAMCYFAHPETGTIVVIHCGKRGYFPLASTRFAAVLTTDTTAQIVDRENARLGISKPAVAALFAGSLFGWDIPAADAASYDASGRPLTAWA